MGRVASAGIGLTQALILCTFEALPKPQFFRKIFFANYIITNYNNNRQIFFGIFWGMIKIFWSRLLGSNLGGRSRRVNGPTWSPPLIHYKKLMQTNMRVCNKKTTVIKYHWLRLLLAAFFIETLDFALHFRKNLLDRFVIGVNNNCILCRKQWRNLAVYIEFVTEFDIC